MKKLPQKKKRTDKRPESQTLVQYNYPDKALRTYLKSSFDLLSPKNTMYINTNNKNEPAKNTKVLQSHPTTPKNKSIKRLVKQNCYGQIKTFKHSPISTPMDLEIRKKARTDYKFLYQIGSGGFGRVWKVQDKRTSETFAMKEMSKAKIIMKKSVNSVVNEREILSELANDFIINMKSAFQDRQFLYLSMEYLRGGDLRYHLCFYEFFTEEQTKFIVACIVVALEYIHSKGILHRDLKPENLVFEENGYLRMTDFGVARKKRANNSEETSGTPGYMAPEVICRMNHSYEADYFGLGVIIYEMMLGYRPYIGDSRKEIRDKILAHQARITKNQLPYGWSENCMDFVNKLLKRNKESRLGFNGIDELKQHPWLKSMNWKKLLKKEIKPPFRPGILSESNEYQKEMENTSVSEVNQETMVLVRTEEIQNLFKSYDTQLQRLR